MALARPAIDDLPVEERLRLVFEHLGIRRAHVAARAPRDFLEAQLLSRLRPAEIAEWRAARSRAEDDGTFFLGWPHHGVVGTRA